MKRPKLTIMRAIALSWLAVGLSGLHSFIRVEESDPPPGIGIYVATFAFAAILTFGALLYRLF